MKCFFDICRRNTSVSLHLSTLLLFLYCNCENSSKSHETFVSDCKIHKADEVSEVRLVGEVDDEQHEVSEVDYDEVSEVREAEE